MNNKELKFNKSAREAMQLGINIVAEAVKVTLGPRGRTVMINQGNGIPYITKDGVTVAKEIKLKDNFQDLGAQLIKEVASRTLTTVGDGTTTSVILAQTIINKGLQLIDNGVSPIAIKRDIDLAVKQVIEYIKSISIPIAGDLEKIRNVATISANNDAVLGKLIADAFSKITLDGVITVEESKSTDTTIEVIQGMQFDRGFVAPHFVTDTVKNIVELLDPVILITEQRINSMRDLVPILEDVAHRNQSIMIIAEDYDSEVIENIKLNKLQGILKIVLVKAPSYGEYRKDILQDIAVLTDGENITYDGGLGINTVEYALLGQCNRVVVTKDSTTIIGGKGKPDAIENRIKQITNLLRTTESDVINDLCKRRIAKLLGGVAVVYVGGMTELEMKERKDRIEDAICATRAAIEEGIVIGGGVTLWRSANIFSDVTYGVEIIRESVKEPLYQILKNNGVSSNLTELFDSAEKGYDAEKDEVCNMMERGIIDPTKVVRLSLENAASVASLVLTTECIIAPEQINIIATL